VFGPGLERIPEAEDVVVDGALVEGDRVDGEVVFGPDSELEELVLGFVPVPVPWLVVLPVPVLKPELVPVELDPSPVLDPELGPEPIPELELDPAPAPPPVAAKAELVNKITERVKRDDFINSPLQLDF
jgi:hypothetical protein